MQRHRLRGGHRVGIDPNSNTYKPLQTQQQQQQSTEQQWSYQQSHWPQQDISQSTRYTPSGSYDQSWNWGNSGSDGSWSAVDEGVVRPNNNYGSNVLLQPKQNMASAQALQNRASPNLLHSRVSPLMMQSRESPHPIQTRAAPHMMQKSESPHLAQTRVSPHVMQKSESPHLAQTRVSPHVMQKMESPHPVQTRVSPHMMQSRESPLLTHTISSVSPHVSQSTTSQLMMPQQNFSAGQRGHQRPSEERTGNNKAWVSQQMAVNGKSSQNQSIDEWGWNEDNWEDWGNGAVSYRDASLISNNASVSHNTQYEEAPSRSHFQGSPDDANEPDYIQNMPYTKHGPTQHEQFDVANANYIQAEKEDIMAVDSRLEQQERSQPSEAVVPDHNHHAVQEEPANHSINEEQPHFQSYRHNSEVQQSGQSMLEPDIVEYQQNFEDQMTQYAVDSVSQVDFDPIHVLGSSNNPSVDAGYTVDSSKIYSQQFCTEEPTVSVENTLIPECQVENREAMQQFVGNIPEESGNDDWKWGNGDRVTRNEAMHSLQGLSQITEDPKEVQLDEKDENILHSDYSNQTPQVASSDLHYSEARHYTADVQHLCNQDVSVGTEMSFNDNDQYEYNLLGCYNQEINESENVISLEDVPVVANYNSYCIDNSNSVVEQTQDIEQHNFLEPRRESCSSPSYSQRNVHETLQGITNTTVTEHHSLSSGLTTWDDEWSDGWGKPREDEKDVTHVQQALSQLHLQEDADSANNNNQYNADVPEMKESVGKIRRFSRNDSVSNIEVLNQELQGIFSAPSDTVLGFTTDVFYPESTNTQTVSSDYLPTVASIPETCQVTTSSYPSEYHDDHFDDQDGFSSSVVQQEYLQDDKETIEEVDNHHEEVNIKQNCDHTVSDLSVTRSLSNDSTDSPLSHQSLHSQPMRQQSEGYEEMMAHPSLNYSHCADHSSLSEGADNNSDSTRLYTVPLLSSSNSLSGTESNASDRNQLSSMIHPPPMGPSGNISTLHARKGSPFQPPAPKRYVAPPLGHLKADEVLSHPSSQSTSIDDQSHRQMQTVAVSSGNVLLEISSVTATGNSLLAHSEPPEQRIKLSVAASSAVLPSVVTSVSEEVLPNAVPIIIPSSTVTAPYQDEGGPFRPSSNESSSSSDRRNSMQYDEGLQERTVPPPAHLSSLQPQSYYPKVHKLKIGEKPPLSPGVLDLTTDNTEKTDSDKSDHAEFYRMVPGGLAKGDSSVTTYQPPLSVPEMPTERVVTGNANPQPVPAMRMKPEPKVRPISIDSPPIRSPPDGPDVDGSRSDHNSTVVPPVRSETIGSEDMVSRPLPVDRRGERSSESHKERQSWEKGYDHYDKYHRDRHRIERGRYGDDSPQYNRYPYDKDSNYHYDDRDRNPHRRDTDDDDDDRDHGRYLELKRERRSRAYRDELERYSDRDSHVRRRRDNSAKDRDYHTSQEEEDPYFEGRSDRSRPSSQSSGYGNLDTEFNSDYGERPHRAGREAHSRDREKDLRDRDMRERDTSYRDYRRKDIRDPYARGYAYPDQYGQREMYDPQSYYYYYYQNYQKYLEQHPYYRDYYRQFYGRYGYATGDSLLDEKASTRSGRSSVNDDMKKSSVSSMAPYDPYGAYYGQVHPSNTSSQFRQDFLNQSVTGGYDPSSVFHEQTPYGALKSYPSGEISGIPSVTDEAGSDVPQRLSPLLFTGPHLSASFSAGGRMVLVLPTGPKEGEKPRVQIRNIQKMLKTNKDIAVRINKMKSYPGPLTVHETHKDTVIRFCKDKAAEAIGESGLSDQESVILFWEYLSLLVKQNGKVCGADLANLLLKGRELGPSAAPSSITATSVVEKSTSSIAHDSSPQDEGMDIKSQQLEKSLSNQAEHIQRFIEYLCLGRKKEAVNYAIKEGLWGYAMVLAAKMDSGTHTRVMSAFIHSIPPTDVFQTLVQHLSGKKPEVAKNYNPERWGDWRLHLAMMVSNPTGQIQRDRASIIALGDALAAKNRIHAAHICYLACEVDWGMYSDKQSKLVLLGSSHQQPFQIFASEAAIQCTEIYEFAKTLDTLSPMMSKFQLYKLIYAFRLTECGFPNEALKYCEVISQAVVRNPESFTVGFVSQLVDLAYQLKYYDVHYQMGEGEISDMADPEWLWVVQNTLYTLQYQASQQQQESSKDLEGVTNSVQEQVVKEEPTAFGYPTTNPDQVYLSYSNVPHSQPVFHSSPEYQFQANSDDMLKPEASYSESMKQSVQPSTQEVSCDGPLLVNQENLKYEDHMQTSIPYEGAPMNSANTQNDCASAPPSMDYYGASDEKSHYPQWHQPQQSWQPEHQQDQQQQLPWQHGQQQQPSEWQQGEQKRQQLAQWQQGDQRESQSQYMESTGHGTGDDVLDSNSLSEDSPPPVRRSEEEEQYWASMAGKEGIRKASATASAYKSSESPNEDSAGKVKEEPLDDKSDDKKSAGFLGSLFGGWRKNNQAKLPDDKNPSIVWDEEKKKWINTDGDDTEDALPPPPPTKVSAPPSVAAFRGGNRKSRYVDPVGEKSRTKLPASPLIPPMPSVTPPQPLMPNLPPKESHMPSLTSPQPHTAQMDVNNQNHLLPESEPQPSAALGTDQQIRRRYISESSSVDLSEDWDLDSSQGISTEDGGSVPMMAPPGALTQPMFFNPAQMMPAQPSNQPKRAGPSRRMFSTQR